MFYSSKMGLLIMYPFFFRWLRASEMQSFMRRFGAAEKRQRFTGRNVMVMVAVVVMVMLMAIVKVMVMTAAW